MIKCYLEDKTLLNNIETSYSRLTDNQKKYVSNYADYTSAKKTIRHFV